MTKITTVAALREMAAKILEETADENPDEPYFVNLDKLLAETEKK